MGHIPLLIQDLALILAVAAVVSILFKRIKQPLVLGYVLAGVLVSPNFHLFPSVSDLANIKIWGEMGVIFLVFALGLEFSFRKLIRVGPAASITGLVEVLFMLGVGLLLGRALGWNFMDSLFLGGILSISSTTIIIKALDELELKTRKFAGLVFGILIVEDLVAVLLLVLLSTVAISQKFTGSALLQEAAKLSFFLVLWFIAGISILPPLFKRASRLLSDEMLLIVSIGLCFGMAVLSSHAGFSPVLGAFVMGSLLAETSSGKKIEHVIKSVKDLFAAVFFVSVGMLLDPKVLVEHAGTILLISAVTIVGKFFATLLGALLSGQSLRHSVQAGLSLAQIGEFSFIIAALGLSLKVTSEFLYPLAVAVSAITTLTTPYLIKKADFTADFLQRKLPQSWVAALERYSASSQRMESRSEWRDVLKARVLRVLLNLVVIVGIFLVGEKWGVNFFANVFDTYNTALLVNSILVLVLSAPFFWALTFGGTKSLSVRELVASRQYIKQIVVLDFFRAVIGVAIFVTLLTRMFSPSAYVFWGAIAIAVLGVAFTSPWLNLVYKWFESRFLIHLDDKQKIAEQPHAHLAPWEAHIAYFEVPVHAPWIGLSLNELKVREKYGVTVAIIERGSRLITAPGQHEKLFPFDRIGVIGSDEQLARFQEFIGQSLTPPQAESVESDYVLRAVELRENSPFLGKSIRNSGLREASEGLVVGIERNGNRILNPDSTLVLSEGDLLWIVGNQKRLAEL